MSKAKLLPAACLTLLTLALGALASTSTPAPAAASWDVNGTLLIGTAALANTALVLSNGKFVFLGGIEIECTGHEILIKNGFIRHPDEILAEDLTFHGCRVVNPTSGCALEGELILTLPLHGLAELDTKGSFLNTLILVSPLPSKTFTVLKFTSMTCALLGIQPVTASKNPAIDLLIDEGGTSAALHLVLAFSLIESLKLGSSEATLSGVDVDIGLASGLPWNFL
jgi:hypothetical protein